jgi:hypothetical protein
VVNPVADWQLIEGIKSLQECITCRMAITPTKIKYSRLADEQISLPGRYVKSNWMQQASQEKRPRFK